MDLLRALMFLFQVIGISTLILKYVIPCKLSEEYMGVGTVLLCSSTIIMLFTLGDY